MAHQQNNVPGRRVPTCPVFPIKEIVSFLNQQFVYKLNYYVLISSNRAEDLKIKLNLGQRIPLRFGY